MDNQEFILGEDNKYTMTDLEYDANHDTEEAKKKINRNITNLIAEFQQIDQVLDENIDFDALEDTETEHDDNTFIDTGKVMKKSYKKSTTDIEECQEYDEVLDDETVLATVKK